MCAAATAAYLYFLAAAGTPEAVEIATWQTQKTLLRLRAPEKKPTREEIEYVRQQHAVSLKRLGRWLWGPGSRFGPGSLQGLRAPGRRGRERACPAREAPEADEPVHGRHGEPGPAPQGASRPHA